MQNELLWVLINEMLMYWKALIASWC